MTRTRNFFLPTPALRTWRGLAATRKFRPIRRYRGLAVFGILSALCGPNTSWAHAILIDSTVHQDARLTAAPKTIRLRLNSRIEHGLSRFTLERNGRQEGTALQAEPRGPDRILVHLPALAPGTAVLRYRVLAADGHITEGVLRFHLTPGSR
ncbi:MAG: copper resistance CopC family protein [Gammaproteobacteria bacterium]